MRGSRRICQSTRRAIAEVTRGAHGDDRSMIARNARPRSCSPVSARRSVGRRLAQQVAVAHEQELVALGRLVHDVARDEQRRARRGELVEGLPELGAQHGIEADRRLVEHQHVGPAEQRGRERDPRALAARERARDAALEPAQADGLDHLADARRVGPDDGGEEAQVLLDAEIAVDRRRLRHVADPAAQRSRAGGLARAR